MSSSFRDDPVVIFCSPRGGSSLVASVFKNSGFWVGPMYGGPVGWRRDGYVTYENESIKNFMVDHWKLQAGDHRAKNLDAGDLRYHIERHVKPPGPWMFKTVSEQYPVWLHHFPRMTPVFVFRDAQQAVEAHVRRRGEKVRDVASRVVRRRYKYMHAILMNNRDAHRVDCERVADFDFSQIEPILEKFGKTIDHRAASSGIIPQKLTR